MAATRRFLVPLFSALLLSLLVTNCSNDSPTKPKEPTGPTDVTMLVVTSPARSAMLADGSLSDGNVTVSGEACDDTDGIASLTVLGGSVPVSGHPTCQAFDVAQTSRWGLSIVTADATSAGGAHESLVQSYLRSPTYLPPASSPTASARVPAASVTQLNQQLLDDGDRNDADDIATIVQRVLEGSDWNAQIPTCITFDAHPGCVVHLVTHGCGLYDKTNPATGYLVQKGGAFTRGPVHVDFVEAYGGKLTTQFSVAGMSLPVSVSGYLDLACLPSPTGNVTGRVLVDNVLFWVSQQISVDTSGNLVSQSPEVIVTWTNLRLNIDWGPLNFISGLLDKITNGILDFFKEALEQFVADRLAVGMPEILRTISSPSQIALPASIGTLLGVNSGFDSFTEGDWYLKFSRFTQFYPKNPVNGREALPHGALRKDGAAPGFTTTPYAFGTGVKDDAVNQLLWAAWAGGAFDFDVVAGDPCLGGLSGSIASIRAGLPPVLMPGRNGHAMDLGLGDLHVEYTVPATLASADRRGASAAPATASFYVSGIAGIELSIDGTTHRIVTTLDPNPEIHIQFESAVGVADTTGLAAGIEQTVRCLYEQRVAAVIGVFPIPEFDLGGLPGFAPGTKLGLANPAVERKDDYTVLTGSAESR